MHFTPNLTKMITFSEISRTLENSRDVQNSKNSKFSGILQNFHFCQNRGWPFLKFPGILVNVTYKNTRMYVFPEIYETQFRFFPETCRPQFLVFVEIWGHPFREFPGISVDKNTWNARIYVFPEILETKFRFFPGNFHEIPKFWIFLNFRKPRNFGERVISTKKGPKFSIFTGFYTKFCLAYRVYVTS